MDNNILSIILYGSHARKDNDISSDFDLCVLTKDREDKEIIQEKIKELINTLEASTISHVIYSEAEVDLMIEYGSLFLWHLKLEGKVIYGENYFTNKMIQLKQFKTHYDEVIYHSEIYQDVKRCWDILSIPNELDLSILFTLTRNTCMVLSHKAGIPSFGRQSSFVTAKELFPDLPMSIDEYMYLSSWKLIYERDYLTKRPIPKPDEYKQLLLDVDGVLSYAIKKLG